MLKSFLGTWSTSSVGRRTEAHQRFYRSKTVFRFHPPASSVSSRFTPWRSSSSPFSLVYQDRKGAPQDSRLGPLAHLPSAGSGQSLVFQRKTQQHTAIVASDSHSLSGHPPPQSTPHWRGQIAGPVTAHPNSVNWKARVWIPSQKWYLFQRNGIAKSVVLYSSQINIFLLIKFHLTNEEK